MSDLKQYSDLFADLAQSAYTKRPNNFEEYKGWNYTQREQEHYGSAILFEFSKRSGGSNLGEKGKVYLQQDSTGILTDEKAGYNSYFVTDQSTVRDSKETYFVTRGSDGMSVENLNDWVNNSANFTLFNAYIPQAKLAEKAMEVVCEETVTNF